MFEGLILMDVQHLQNADFSFEKGWNSQYHSSGSHLLIKISPPAKFSVTPTPLNPAKREARNWDISFIFCAMRLFKAHETLEGHLSHFEHFNTLDRVFQIASRDWEVSPTNEGGMGNLWRGIFFIGWWEPKVEWFWLFEPFSKLKITFCKYWTLIKIKIGMTRVYKVRS